MLSLIGLTIAAAPVVLKGLGDFAKENKGTMKEVAYCLKANKDNINKALDPIVNPYDGTWEKDN